MTRIVYNSRFIVSISLFTTNSISKHLWIVLHLKHYIMISQIFVVWRWSNIIITIRTKSSFILFLLSKFILITRLKITFSASSSSFFIRLKYVSISAKYFFIFLIFFHIHSLKLWNIRKRSLFLVFSKQNHSKLI